LLYLHQIYLARRFGSTITDLRDGGSWFAVVTFSLQQSKLPRVFPTSRHRPLASSRFHVRKGRVVVLHPVLWVVGGGFVSCRILAILLRVKGLGFFYSDSVFVCYDVCWFVIHDFDFVVGSLGSGCNGVSLSARKSLFSLLCFAGPAPTIWIPGSNMKSGLIVKIKA
jgi:hypothetical protein